MTLSKSKKRFMIIAETTVKGYIIDFELNEENAINQGEFIFNSMVKNFSLKNADKDKMNYLYEYSFYEQVALHDKSVWLCSDGLNSVYVLEVTNDFRIDIFIKCRTSHQYVVKFDENSEQLSDISNRREIYFNAMAN